MNIDIKLVEMPYGNLSRRWLATIEAGEGEPVCCLCHEPFQEKQDAWMIGQNKLNCLRRNCLSENGMPLGANTFGHSKAYRDTEEDFFILIDKIIRKDKPE